MDSTSSSEIQPRYPDNLSIIERVDSTSDEEQKHVVFPIMSISKSFFAATCALMALDGDFGEKGFDATLEEALEQAKLNNPDKADNIEKYLNDVIRHNNLGDIKIYEILTHRSGIKEKYGKFEEYKDRIYDFLENSIELADDRGQWHYSNIGFITLEEVVNLCSKKGGYLPELQARILDPLGLIKTGSVEEGAFSSEAKSKLEGFVTLPGFSSPFDGEKEAQELREYPDPLKTETLGRIPNSAGGLYSTIHDMEIYAAELSKMICGVPGKLELDQDKAREIHRLYREKRDTREDQTACYLPGIAIIKKENDGKMVICHSGQFRANNSDMEIETSIIFDDFINGKEVDPSQLENPRIEIYMQRCNFIAKKLIFDDKEKREESEKFLRRYLTKEGIIDNERINQDFLHENGLEEYHAFIAKETNSPSPQTSPREKAKSLDSTSASHEASTSQ